MVLTCLLVTYKIFLFLSLNFYFLVTILRLLFSAKLNNNNFKFMNSAQTIDFKNSTTERVSAALGLIGIAAGAFVVGYFNPVTAGFFPQCPFHALTGLNCPGCGMTRGFNALFHGDILTAIHFNALLPIFAFIFSYFAFSLFLITVRGRGLSWKFFSPKILTAFLVVVVIYAIVRNLPFYPFSLLAI